MPTDLTIMLDDKPGTLADLGEAAGKAGINFDGVCAVAAGGRAEIHLVVGDAPGATQALRDAGYGIERERDVIVVDVEDRPGGLGDAARKVADAGANIELLYLATGTRLVIGADNLDAARRAFGS